ncbi:MAG: T9SS type A sorting domain-containing protein, partial [Flavobacteriales bacterium]|nr:T9SS type A sorting domain-containing protein [Flavobacteriales bacterium]
EQDFDAEAFDDYSDLFYSVLEGKKLVIQGKSDAFTVEDRVPLGANFYQNGVYTISLDNTEGIFNTGQTIYLKDKQAGITANLSEGSYTFQATKGLSNGRFEIVYQPEIVLVTDSKVKNGVEVYRDSGDFVVKAQNKKITALQVFDASGRLVYSVTPNSLQTVIPADKLLNSIYVLKISQGGIITTRKIMK